MNNDIAIFCLCCLQASHHQRLVIMLLPCKVLVLLEESWVARWHSTKLPTEDPNYDNMRSEAVEHVRLFI